MEPWVEPWGHCLLPGVYRLPLLSMLGGLGSKNHRVLNRRVIGGKQHVGGRLPAVAGLDSEKDRHFLLGEKDRHFLLAVWRVGS